MIHSHISSVVTHPCGCETVQRNRSIVDRVVKATLSVFCLGLSASAAVATPVVPVAIFPAITFATASVALGIAAFTKKTVRSFCANHRPSYFYHTRPVVIRPSVHRPTVINRPHRRPVRTVATESPRREVHRPVVTPHREPVGVRR